MALSKRLDRYLRYHTSVARVNVKDLVSCISSQRPRSDLFGVHEKKLKELTEFVLVKSTLTIVDLILRPLRLLIVVIGFEKTSVRAHTLVMFLSTGVVCGRCGSISKFIRKQDAFCTVVSRSLKHSCLFV